tara:strand:- start:270 stop:932 length:663 start_codon:yes stop_codon:yes gene_type:complete
MCKIKMNQKIIYKVINTKNNKIYIGATTVSLESRKYDHLLKARVNKGSILHKALATFKPEDFNWVQLDTASNNNELAEKEKQYILKYNSKEGGYNADSGGGIKKTVYQYSKKGELLAEYDCLESAANAVNVHKNSISNTCLGQNKTCTGFYWSYKLYEKYPIILDFRKKKVLQIDLNDKIVNEFDSVSEASRVTGISKTCIARVCRSERKQTSGYKFKYK